MNRQSLPLAIFSDFNGTITSEDMLAALLRSYGKDDVLEQISQARSRGLMSLRERIASEACNLTCSLEEADERVARTLYFDESFCRFYRQYVSEGISLTIVSSGIEPLIVRLLSRYAVRALPVFANGVDPRPDGWRVLFRDTTAEGNAKQPYVEAAMQAGFRTAIIGDDESDFGMALVADVRFAKRASPLAAYLDRLGVNYDAFETFDDVSKRLRELAA